MKFLILTLISVLWLAGCGFSSKWVKPMEEQNYAILEQNIASGADLEAKDDDGNTALHHAARLGDLRAMKILIEAGADVYAANDLAMPPFAMAMGHAQVDAAKLLVDIGITDFNRVKIGRSFQKMVDKGMATAERFKYPLDYWLIHAPGHVAFSTLSESQHVEIMEYLFKSGFELNKDFYTGSGYKDINAFVLGMFLKNGATDFINIANWRGNALFDQHDADVLKLLLANGADQNFKDKNGQTAFHLVAGVASGNQSFMRHLNAYITAGFDPMIKDEQGRTVYEYTKALGNKTVIDKIKEYESSYLAQADVGQEFETCGIQKEIRSKADCYRTFTVTYPNHQKTTLAKQRLRKLDAKLLVIANKKRAKQRAVRVARQACKLKNQDWEYLSKACKGGYAHGTGQAINEEKNLKFVGQFKAGLRVQGEIFAYGNLMYDGPLKNDRPHGKGICMHEGEPEDCNYYKGKRTDVLYKQRIEFAKQREMLASTEKRINQSLKETESNIDEKLANIQVQSGTGYQGASAQDLVMDAVKKKAAEEAADFLFDKLF